MKNEEMGEILKMLLKKMLKNMVPKESEEGRSKSLMRTVSKEPQKKTLKGMAFKIVRR